MVLSEMKDYKLGDICTICSSKRIFAKEYREKGIPFFRSKEIIELAENKNISAELFIDEDRYEEIKIKFSVPQKGEILLSSIGANLGIAYYIELENRFYFKDGNVTWFKDFNNEVNSKFVYYWLRSKDTQNTLKNIAIGSAQPALTIEGLKNLNITLPNLQYQEGAAHILSSLDNKIKVNNQINDKLQYISQILFKRWFIDFEFPSEDGLPYKSSGGEMVDSELGIIPKGWEVCNLAELTEKVTRRNKDNICQNTVTISAVDGITNSYFTNRVASKDLSKYILLNKDEFVYNRSLSTGYPVGAVRRLNRYDNAVVSSIYLCFKINQKSMVNFFEMYFLGKEFENKLYQVVQIGSRGHGMLNYNIDDFFAIKLVKPENAVLEKYNEIFEALRKETNILSEQNNNLTKIGDEILHKLMPGELDLSNLEINT